MKDEQFKPRPAPQPERVAPPETSREEIQEKKLGPNDLYYHNGVLTLIHYPPETKEMVAELRGKLSGDDKGKSTEEVIQKILYAFSDLARSGIDPKKGEEGSAFISRVRKALGDPNEFQHPKTDELKGRLLNLEGGAKVINNPEVKRQFAKERGITIG